MDLSGYRFSEQEILRLQEYRDGQSDARLKVRFISVLMLAKGFEILDVASVIGKSVKTIENWLHQYVTKGIDSLNSFQYVAKKTYLTNEQIDQVVNWVKETNPSKTKEVKQYIKDHFKITYHVEAVRQLLNKNGLKVLRPKALPGKTPSEEEQKKTSKNILK